MLHHAVGLAQPGDVLVNNRTGNRTCACLGNDAYAGRGRYRVSPGLGRRGGGDARRSPEHLT